jgi:hypothetical protein
MAKDTCCLAEVVLECCDVGRGGYDQKAGVGVFRGETADAARLT